MINSVWLADMPCLLPIVVVVLGLRWLRNTPFALSEYFGSFRLEVRMHEERLYLCRSFLPYGRIRISWISQ